ncbi:MAG: C4-dicarboxylate transporter/malic acid transport protein [candidate division TM6 bacterium GW2011_GWE2_42_60]|nr:MAG: C4-dicarboxylate transporter/malic acid transport protein [candidate division TM6 bacterium GW2011_GWE2_42_60]HBY05928.1 C4-dicarboxylate ABC transporter [Candidatus Dependentiae bacterium]
MNLAKRIPNFPVSFFSVVMGLVGFIIAFEKAVEIFQLSGVIPLVILGATATIFFGIGFMYLAKLVLHKEEVIKEFNHPVKISFFPTFSVSLLLFSIALLPFFQSLSFVVWLFGTVLHLIFTFVIISQWIRHDRYHIEHLSPIWFIPVVGNLLIPVAGSVFVSGEILWPFFSVGIVFWIMLMTIVIYRIFFHPSLPEKIKPTLFILIAPPAIAFISYFKLTHQVDSFSKILYYFSFFLALLLLLNIRALVSKKFYLSLWAFTFPLTAIATASALMFNVSKLIAFKYLFIGFLGVSGSMIVVLSYKTIKAIYLHEICEAD